LLCKAGFGRSGKALDRRWEQLLGDTIAALATAVGEAGVSVVRLSGPEAVTCAARVFRCSRLESLAEGRPRRVYHGWLLDGPGGRRLDDGLAWFSRAPHSFTGEDVVEISCHGGVVASRLALEAVLRGGARLADPGEFTRRAFLNGRLDLAQAEATIDLVQARTGAAFDAARRRLEGELSRRVSSVADRLLGVMAEIEARGDFPDLELEELEPPQVSRELRACMEALRELLAGAEEGRLLREGLRVVLAGRPNVGKSSLLNALLGEERAIVSAVPGTTRDVIEEALVVEGVPVVLADTAGLRESADPLELAGTGRTAAALRQADVVVFVIDAGAGWLPEDEAAAAALPKTPVIVAVNKSDLRRWAPETAMIERIAGGTDVLEVSARTGQGLGALRQAIARAAGVRRREEPMLGTVRQKHAVERAVASLETAAAAVEGGVSLDLAAVDLREAWGALGEVTGENAPEALLDEVFSRFCIGK